MAERIEGLSIGLDLDSLSVESGLQDLNKKLSLVNSEMKANLSAFDKGDKSLQRYGVLLDGLNKKLEVQKTRTESARQTYERMVKEHGEGSTQAEKAAVAYNKEVTSLNNLEKTIGAVSKEMKDSQSITLKFGDQLTKISEKADKMGNILTATVTPAIAGVGTAAIIAATNFSDSVSSIQTNLGVTEEEALRLGNVANDVFKLGWGESLSHVTSSLLEVREQLGEMSDTDLAFATKQAIALEQALGMDQSETLRGVNALMKAYGMTAEEAFNYVITGAQNGLNKTDELGDNLAEYAVQFEQSGYSAKDMFSILQEGLDSGAYNLDKVNDLVKEFGIRVGDGTIKTALEDMGWEWQEIYNGWEEAGGTNAELFELMAKHLQSIEDPQEKQMALTEIWGSVGEDSAIQIIEAMGDVEDKYDDVSGAAQKLNDQMEDSRAQKFTGLMNTLMDTLVPVGDILLEIGDKAIPILQDAVEALEETWNGLTEEQQEMVVQAGLFLAAGGPMIKVFAGLAGGAGKFTKGLYDVISKIAGKKGVTDALSTIPASATSAGTAVSLFSNPWVLGIGAITLAVGGLGYLIYQEATSHEQDHQESIENTKGKYNDWFQAVMDGSVDAAEAQKQIQDATNTTGETYEEMTRRLKEQNQDVLGAINSAWGGESLLKSYSFIEKVTMGWQNVHEEAVNGISMSLKDLAGVTEEELARIEAGYFNYGTMLGNTMYDVVNTFSEGKEITLEYANANIEAMNLTKDEVVAALTAQRDAEQARLDKMRENLGESYALYDEDTQKNQEYYANLIQQTQTSTDNISAILRLASEQQRELTAEEVVTILGEYEKLAAGSGQSLSNVKEAQDLLAANMKSMVTSVGLDAMVQTGIISQETANQIAAIDNEKGRVDALKQALQDYNSTTIPEKGILIKSNAWEMVNSVHRALATLTDKTVYIDTINSSWNEGASVSGGGALLAIGDTYFRGGFAILGDGGRAEPFLTPSGEFGISPPTDTLFNLEQGTKIWPSIHAFKMDLPHFATGAQGSTEVQRMLANYRINSTQQTTENVITNSQPTVIEGDEYHIHLTVYGEIPMENIDAMAERLSVAMEKKNQQKKRNRGIITHGPR